MHLYLMRHSIAESTSTTDFERRLTAQGIEKAKNVGKKLSESGFSPGVIVHSPLIRSQQTALVFREFFPGTPLVELKEVVSANASLLRILGGAGWSAPLIVGHNPSISMLATALSGRESPLSFHTCSFAAFEVDRLPPTKASLIEWLPHSE